MEKRKVVSKKSVSFSFLANYLPEGTFDMVYAYIQTHRVELTITRERLTVLGNYRNSTPSSNHRISVNGNLNKYAFLYTLLHEIAHLLVFNQHAHRVASHGIEWKMQFRAVLKQFLQLNIFPEDIRNAIEQSLENLAASSCADAAIIRVFRNYDEQKSSLELFVEDLELDDYFIIKGGRLFKRGEKIRTRYKCLEVHTKKIYLFSPVAEVYKMTDADQYLKP